MADDLPPLRFTWDANSQSFSKNRKRMRFSSPPVSSDPAIFSSDDDPSADNYTQERRKKKYRGPWYQQRPAADVGYSREQDLKRKGKRIFERQFDSGIFMGSDGTDMEGDDFELMVPSKPLPKQPRTIQAVQCMPSAEEAAQEEIARCLDEGVEAIDLSSQCLTTLSNTTIRPLATFTRVPTVTQGVFSKLEPKLKLFLASNCLTTLPGELFNLNRLTVLSLRANNFLELPPSIGKLTNLKELNLSQNCLSYLPFEILDLFLESARLQSLHLHPNPFLEPHFPETSKAVDTSSPCHPPPRERHNTKCGKSLSNPQQRNWHEQWRITYQARTQVRFLDINGRLLQGPEFPSQASHERLLVADDDDSPVPPEPRGNGISRGPSLLEVALAACSRSPQLLALASYLPEHSPVYMYDALALVEAKKESGGSKCTVCGRNFILARAEWIEWWEIAKVAEQEAANAASPLRQIENERDVLEKMVPLIRRGCSWQCIPAGPLVKEDVTMTQE